MPFPTPRPFIHPSTFALEGGSFRAGSAPFGIVVHPTGANGTHIAIRRMLLGSGGTVGKPTDPAVRARMRAQLEDSLQLHLARSAPQQGGAESPAGVPRWALRCERGHALREFTLHFMKLCHQAAGAEVGVNVCTRAFVQGGRGELLLLAVLSRRYRLL